MPTRSQYREFLRERQKAPHRANFSLSTGVGLWLGHHPPGDQYPTLGPEGWLWPTVYCQSKGDVSWRGSAWIWRICQITRRVASLCPKQRSQTLRTPLPPRWCALGSGDMMNSTAQWSLKRLPYAAIINCSAQEYDTPSTINEGDHCENRTGLPEQNHIICGVFERKIKSRRGQPVGSRAGNLGL